MAQREIDHVDVVAHAGAVARGPVGSEHRQALALADRGLRDAREKVVRDVARILADQAARMRANWVEVTQRHDAHRGLGRAQIAQQLLVHQLGRAVRVDGRKRHVLREGQFPRNPVDRGRRAEHEALHAGASAGVQQGNRAAYVVVVVVERAQDRFAHSLQRREVDHRFDRRRGKCELQQPLVADVAIDPPDGVARDALDPAQRLGAAVREIVDAHDVVTGGKQLDQRMAANISGAPGDEDRCEPGTHIELGALTIARALRDGDFLGVPGGI